MEIVKFKMEKSHCHHPCIFYNAKSLFCVAWKKVEVNGSKELLDLSKEKILGIS